jgi:hypothetical protein
MDRDFHLPCYETKLFVREWQYDDARYWNQYGQTRNGQYLVAQELQRVLPFYSWMICQLPHLSVVQMRDSLQYLAHDATYFLVHEKHALFPDLKWPGQNQEIH